MSLETVGTVLMKGEEPPGVPVQIVAAEERLKIEANGESWGDWSIHDLRISALSDGFAIRAEGEEFILRAEDDVGLAEELHMAAASPRLARKMAASHNTAERPRPPAPPPIRSNVAALAFALAGALVLVGAVFLQAAGDRVDSPGASGGSGLWFFFVVGGVLMVASGWLMTLGNRWPFVVALVVVAGIVVGFGLMVSDAVTEGSFVIAYAFIAGGLVVGVSVLFSTSLRPTDS